MTGAEPASDGAMERAAACLAEGRLVVFPTDTVYGLAADAANADAVRAVFAAKERPRTKPLIVLCADTEAARCLGVFSPLAEALAAAFWPGPLSLVLEARDNRAVCAPARAGSSTIALRVPDHDVAQGVLRSFGGYLVAPSANISGHPCPLCATGISEELRPHVAMILEGPLGGVGLESSIVDARGTGWVLLRSGALRRACLEAVAAAQAFPAGTALPAGIGCGRVKT